MVRTTPVDVEASTYLPNQVALFRHTNTAKTTGLPLLADGPEAGAAKELTPSLPRWSTPRMSKCVFQSLEVAEPYSAMDSCYLLAHSECKGTPVDTDARNRLACSHGFIEPSTAHQMGVRIPVSFVDVQNPVLLCEGQGERSHPKFRVNLLVELMTDEHRKSHRCCWKEGT